MRKTQKLRFLNAAIWFSVITVSLFIIGFAARVGGEWTKTPVDRIGTNNFRFHIVGEGSYFIYFQCDGDGITASYDLSTGRHRSFPDEIDLLDKVVRWTAVNDSEIFSASMAASFVFSGKEAFKQFGAYNSARLDNVRLIRRAAKSRWFMMAVLSLGGYWAGDYAASQFDIPCRRSDDLDWLKTVDWAALTRAIYDHRVHELERCVNSLEMKLRQTQNPALQELKAEYIGPKDTLSERLTVDRLYILGKLLELFPSPQMTFLLQGNDIDIVLDFMYEVTGEDLAIISASLGECSRIASSL